MTTGVAIPGGSGPLSIRNLLCGGDVHGNALGRWSMLALPELPACCLVICLSHTATGRFLLRMSGARTDEPGVKRRGLRAGGLIGLAVGGKQGCDRRRHLVVGRGHDTRRLGRRGRPRLTSSPGPRGPLLPSPTPPAPRSQTTRVTSRPDLRPAPTTTT